MQQTKAIKCPGCGRSDQVLHRGGSDRQCGHCRWTFQVEADGATSSGAWDRWLTSRKRQRSRARLRGQRIVNPSILKDAG